MNKRQKIFVTGVIIIVLASVVAAVSYSPRQVEMESDKLKIVATFYTLAFFAQQIGGEEVIVKQFIPDNTEVHNWQPSFSDILAVEGADVIIYNGATLDDWFTDDILPVINQRDKVIVETIEGTTLPKTGLELTGEHEELDDPHTWISPFIAKQQAQKIYEALIRKDPTHMDYYTERWQNLEERLKELDIRYMSELANKKKDTIFVAHSAFGYLAERYGFKQYGIIGISADEQPSASVYANLIKMMIEQEIYVVYVDPVYLDESAQTLKNALETFTKKNVQILKLYVMLGTIDGLDYFGQQEKNLENLKIGLEA